MWCEYFYMPSKFFLHYLSSFHNFLLIFSICLWEELHCLVLGASTSGNRVVMLKRLRFICIVTIIIIVMTIMHGQYYGHN